MNKIVRFFSFFKIVKWLMLLFIVKNAIEKFDLYFIGNTAVNVVDEKKDYKTDLPDNSKSKKNIGTIKN